MTAPIEITPAAAAADPDAAPAGIVGPDIEGRSLGQIAWRRLRRDKVAMAGGIVILVLILIAIIPPTPSWGQMLANAVQQGFYSVDPMYMIIPGLAIFITILAFNLFGDGLRDALDPRSK